MTPERQASIRQWAWTQRGRTIDHESASVVEELLEYIELLQLENTTLQQHIDSDHTEWNRQIRENDLGNDRREE